MATSETHARNRLSAGAWFRRNGWRHLVLWVAVGFALWPVMWILSAAFNALNTLTTTSLIPDRVTLDNFRELFTNDLKPFGNWLWNSTLIALVVSTVQVFFSAMAAYAFARMEWKGRRGGLLLILLLQLFPQFLAFVAILQLVNGIGDIWAVAGPNTQLGLILVYLGGSIGVNTWLIKGFMDTVPGSLDEAAVVDGASTWDVFYRIILPLSRPVLAVVWIITFVFVFGEFVLASVLISDTTKLTLAPGLQFFVESDYEASWGPLAAASLLASLPVVAIYLPMQDQLVGGLTSGAVKG